MRHRPDDIRISRVGDRKSGDAEIFTTGGTQLDVISRVMVHSSLGQHSVVLDLGFPENEIEILEKSDKRISGLNFGSYLRGGVLLAMMTNLALPILRVSKVFL